MFSTNNISQKTNIQIQNFTDYPDVFFTKNYNHPQQPQALQNYNHHKNTGSFFGLSKDMIGQFLPLLFGKGGSGNNFLASLLQNGTNSNNNILSNLLSGNKNISEIFSVLNQTNNPNNNKQNNKKDMPSIIDMSDYKEIKS